MIQIRYASSFLTPTADVLSDHINPTMPQLLGDGHPRRCWIEHSLACFKFRFLNRPLHAHAGAAVPLAPAAALLGFLGLLLLVLDHLGMGEHRFDREGHVVGLMACLAGR